MAIAPISLAITGIGLECAFGEAAADLWGAVANRLNAIERHPTLRVETVLSRERSIVPVHIAPAEPLDGAESIDRAVGLAASALERARAPLARRIAPERVLVVTLAPPRDTPRGRTLRSHAGCARLTQALHGRDGAEYRLCDAAVGGMALLQQAADLLRRERFDAVVFGGVDSLMDMATCRGLIEDGRAQAPGLSDGVRPGEAAGYCVLERWREAAHAGTALGRIDAIHTGDADAEPHGERFPVGGLSQAIAAVLESTSTTASALDGIIHGGSRMPAHELDWDAIAQRHFAREVTDERRLDLMHGHVTAEELPPEPDPERLFLGQSVGCVGAATLPLQMILACGRFGFRLNPAHRLLVCEWDEHGSPGALLLGHDHTGHVLGFDALRPACGDPFIDADFDPVDADGTPAWLAPARPQRSSRS